MRGVFIGVSSSCQMKDYGLVFNGGCDGIHSDSFLHKFTAFRHYNDYLLMEQLFLPMRTSATCHSGFLELTNLLHLKTNWIVKSALQCQARHWHYFSFRSAPRGRQEFPLSLFFSLPSMATIFSAHSPSFHHLASERVL